ncbi:MAG: type II toxin-antitoxin system prevent-host-death family antitoxin [Candidatus Jacksonbacteria bacterium]
MKTQTITATKARNNWFEILNLTYFKGVSFIITKNNLPMIKLVPAKKINLISAQDVIDKTFGSFKDVKITDWPKENQTLSQRKFKSMNLLWKQ